MAKSKPRVKMPIGERAKQFAPFSPLSGLEEALAERERRKEPRRYPDRDAVTAINNALSALKNGDSATVFFYNSAETRYEQIDGKVSIIDDFHQRIFVAGTEIRFEDILELEITQTRDI